MSRGDLIEFGSSTNSKKSFMGSSTRLWNVAPEDIKKVLPKQALWIAETVLVMLPLFLGEPFAFLQQLVSSFWLENDVETGF